MTTQTPSDSFEDRSLRQIRNPALAVTLGNAMDRIGQNRARALEGVDLEATRLAAEAIRAHTVGNLHTYLARFAEKAAERGIRVFFAADADEAVAYVKGVLAQSGARLVVKGKSMAAEEIGLNAAVEAEGIEVAETDLGEYIVQIAHEAPSHIIVPAVHKTSAEITDLFNAVHGTDLPDDPSRLTAFARKLLRAKFLAADVGITGVNFAVADEGMFAIVSNEGNGRMSSTVPRTHVAIMGMERIVPSLAELGFLIPLLTASATGQRITSYLSLIGGPRAEGELDGPEEVHVVVLDNGRSQILGSEYSSVLHCIRCGACQNVCPVYRHVGGHGYGTVYGGPIGAVLTPLLAGLDRAGDLAHASSLCGACTQVCPVRIPLHEHLLGLRRDGARSQAGPGEKIGFHAWSAIWAHPSTTKAAIAAAGFAQRLAARVGIHRLAPPPLSAWVKGRDVPQIAERSFRRRFEEGLGRGR